MDLNCLDSINIQYHVNSFANNVSDLESFNILYINIRSIRNSFEELKDLIVGFKFTVHAIILTEVWIYDSERNDYELLNYTSHFSIRDGNRGGGCGIYILNNIISHTVADIPINDHSVLVVKLSQYEINIIAVYRKERNTNLDDFLSLLDSTLSKFKNSYVIGDFNVDLLEIQKNTVQKYHDCINMCGYLLLNKVHADYATRISKNRKSILDHCISDITTNPLKLSLIDSYISDHRIIVLNITINNKLGKHRDVADEYRTILSYEKINLVNFKSKVDNTSNFDDLIQCCTETIELNKKVLKRKKKLSKKPWMNNRILHYIERRDYFYKLKVRYPNTVHFSDQFKKFKTLTESLIEKTKKAYFINEMKSNDPRYIWTLANKYIFNKSQSNDKILLMNSDNIPITNDELVSNLFNNYFITCIDDLFA